ncbi:MAG: hypothetical protein HYS13_06905 [Planctomycetia bacterium]|nr:hypothetical protein [Planctomycetia bacterium]
MQFLGTQMGKTTVKVVVTVPPVPPSTCEDTQDLVVIEINDLGSVQDQLMDQVFITGETSGSHLVPYNTADGDLRRVGIVPPYDAADPYDWGTDFKAEVDHADGHMDMTFYRAGTYIVEVLRVKNEGQPDQSYMQQLFSVWYNAGDLTTEDPKREDGPFQVSARPTADLVLISSSTSDNGSLVNARSQYENEVAIGSVSDVITAIQNYSQAHPGQEFSVLIVDHGNVALQAMGSGQKWPAPTGKYIDNTSASQNDVNAFTAACNANNVSLVIFGACEVARDAGDAWLQATRKQRPLRISRMHCKELLHERWELRCDEKQRLGSEIASIVVRDLVSTGRRCHAVGANSVDDDRCFLFGLRWRWGPAIQLKFCWGNDSDKWSHG